MIPPAIKAVLRFIITGVTIIVLATTLWAILVPLSIVFGLPYVPWHIAGGCVLLMVLLRTTLSRLVR